MLSKLANALKAARRERKITGAKLAAKLKVSRQAISGWEQGQFIPEPKRVKPLARVLGLKPEHLRSLVTEAMQSRMEW